MFEFDLKKVETNEIDLVKEQLDLLSAQRSEIDKELKLFSNYFFNHWKEQDRDVLK